MNFETVMQLIGRWGGTLKFFSADPDARIGIAEEISEMAANEDQVRWLVKRMPKLYQEWPGMQEVRAVFCSKFKPVDGIETYSSVYLNGVPTEKEQLPALAAPPTKQLASGEPVSAAGSLRDFIRDAVQLKNMNRIGAPPAVRDIPVVRINSGNAITAADIAQAVKELREKKAAEVIAIEVQP